MIKRCVLLLASIGVFASSPASPVSAGETDGPSEVFVGAYINDVKEVDLTTNSFAVDMYVWLRWTDPDIDPSVSIDTMNPRDGWVVETSLYEEPLQLSDGSYYNVIRLLGSFSVKLPLEDYPFDQQTLTLILEDSELPITDLVYVPDPLSETMANPKLQIPGWQWDKPVTKVFNEPYPSTWGNTDAVGDEAYSRVVIELPVHRPAVSSAIKMFFPLALVLLTAVLTFFLKPSMVESKIGTAITALLTLVALQFTVMGSLPAVGYLTMIEVIYALSYMFVLYALGVSVLTVWSKRDVEGPEAVRYDRRTMLAGVGVYLVAFAATLLVYLL